ncbi:MAG: hypothetical protein PHN49_03720, partial [Candidatus Omnitrophica bacterium]|nr:hypothetical protein [Candidatus Omnitrophota bacterium]
MKTFLKTEWNKVLICFLCLSMAWTQVLPYGFADGSAPVENDPGALSVPEIPQGEQPTSADLTTEPAANPDDFYNPPAISGTEGDPNAALEATSEEDSGDVETEKRPQVIPQEERDEVKQVLGVEPATSKITNAMATSNSSYLPVEYYDADGKLIGSKTTISHVNPLGEVWKAAEYIWKDAQGYIVSATDDRLTAYYDRLRQFDEFMSGIAVNGITLEQIKNLRNIQDDLKAVIESIIAAGETPSDEILTAFKQRIAVLDEALAQRPLLIAIGERTIEVNVSEVMRVLYEEYKRLGLVDTQDLDRLPGIDSADLVGHEDFAAYLASRQIGMTTIIPVFKGLSAYGNITFVHALLIRYVEEFGDPVLGGDRDNDSL